MDKNRLILSLNMRESLFVNSRKFVLNNLCDIPTILTYLNFDTIDELVVLNIGENKKSIKDFSRDLKLLNKRAFLPVAAGGGVKSLEDCYTLLQAGIEKIVINTAAFNNPHLITQISNTFGRQFVTVSIDVKKVSNKDIVFIENGTISTNLDVGTWAKQVEHLGAGEIYLRSIDKDGTAHGYDLDLISQVSNLVNIPIVASGGVGEFQHFAEGIKAGANAVSLGNLFHFVGEDLIKAKDYLRSDGHKFPKSKWNFSIKESQK